MPPKKTKVNKAAPSSPAKRRRNNAGHAVAQDQDVDDTDDASSGPASPTPQDATMASEEQPTASPAAPSKALGESPPWTPAPSQDIPGTSVVSSDPATADVQVPTADNLNDTLVPIMDTNEDTSQNAMDHDPSIETDGASGSKPKASVPITPTPKDKGKGKAKDPKESPKQVAKMGTPLDTTGWRYNPVVTKRLERMIMYEDPDINTFGLQKASFAGDWARMILVKPGSGNLMNVYYIAGLLANIYVNNKGVTVNIEPLHPGDMDKAKALISKFTTGGSSAVEKYTDIRTSMFFKDNMVIGDVLQDARSLFSPGDHRPLTASAFDFGDTIMISAHIRKYRGDNRVWHAAWAINKVYLVADATPEERDAMIAKKARAEITPNVSEDVSF